MDIEAIKVKFWDTIKALPYDGGPSSTRFVYLSAAGTICVVILALTGTFCWVYGHSGDHTASVVVAGLIGSTVTVLVGFAANAQVNKNNGTKTGD